MKKWIFAAALSLLAPLQAFASFHLMKVVEVFPGSPQNPNAQYVVLQMYANGQTFVGNHSVTFSNSAGTAIAGGSFAFADVPVNAATNPSGQDLVNGTTQDKILIATAEAQALFGITPDLVMTPVIPAAGGKVCFDAIDCVAWGNFAGSPTGVGTAFNKKGGGLLLGSAMIRRLDIFGNPTNLENSDDTGQSANDFFLGAPAPKNNARQLGVAAGICGNGTLEGAEGCDDNNTTAGDGCNAQCLLEFCGDGIDNNGVAEECEDNNNINTDACTNLCRIAVCGDGFVQTGVEACDDGNQNNLDSCSSTCQIIIVATCNNGVIDAGETCDDSNNNNNDGCNSICQLESCGDGTAQTNEECDDGNTAANDGCSANCEDEICGDGIVNNGDECDDGNIINDDACNNLCLSNFCGDAAINNGEACDDGNEEGDDGCDPGCTIESCGDGVTQSDPNRPEQCDDGNAINTDDCLNSCANASCGDGFIQSGLEDCDDGNLTNGDGCEDSCTVTANEPEPRGCFSSVASNNGPASFASLFALFAFALFIRRRKTGNS
jgi:cysteine-rich repeat protein